jgi:hypothetical protein
MNEEKPTAVGLGGIGLPDEVYGWIRRGAPGVALARALGVPFGPWVPQVRFTFDTPDPQVSPVVGFGSETRITQETIVQCIIVRTSIDRTPISPFDAPSDNAFNFTQPIDATLDISGVPKYTVTPDFTPLQNLADAFNGNSEWPWAWVLTDQQGVKMQFQSRIRLPDFPVTVTVTFRCWQPVTDLLRNASTRDVVAQLRELGYTIPDRYLDYLR